MLADSYINTPLSYVFFLFFVLSLWIEHEAWERGLVARSGTSGYKNDTERPLATGMPINVSNADHSCLKVTRVHTMTKRRLPDQHGQPGELMWKTTRRRYSLINVFLCACDHHCWLARVWRLQGFVYFELKSLVYMTSSFLSHGWAKDIWQEPNAELQNSLSVCVLKMHPCTNRVTLTNRKEELVCLLVWKRDCKRRHLLLDHLIF